ncbi:MAG TPA: LysR family transcriptional regulator [Caulobacteraceae bacterium]
MRGRRKKIVDSSGVDIRKSMSTEPDWGLHRTFLAVVEEGSLSGAARRLGLTQPTVARHVDALEAAIGGGLFLRSQRGMIATDMALALRPYAETLAATAAALMREASGAEGTVRGAVRISASEIIGVELLPPILAGLRRRYPELVVELVVSNAIEDLLQRDADIAVRNVEPAQDALVARRLPPVELGLHARADYLERRGTPRTVADLAHHDVIGFDRESPAIRALLRDYPAFGRDTFALRADSDLAQLAAIRAGFGIGLCQASIAGREGALTRVLAGPVSIEMGVWVVMHEDRRRSARCRAVFEALVQGLTRPYDKSGEWRARSDSNARPSDS